MIFRTIPPFVWVAFTLVISDPDNNFSTIGIRESHGGFLKLSAGNSCGLAIKKISFFPIAKKKGFACSDGTIVQLYYL